MSSQLLSATAVADAARKALLGAAADPRAPNAVGHLNRLMNTTPTHKLVWHSVAVLTATQRSFRDFSAHVLDHWKVRNGLDVPSRFFHFVNEPRQVMGMRIPYSVELYDAERIQEIDRIRAYVNMAKLCHKRIEGAAEMTNALHSVLLEQFSH